MAGATDADDYQQHDPGLVVTRLPRRIKFLGHASVLIDLDDTRIITDPLLRRRVSGLYWRHPSPHSAVNHPIDSVVISHMHQDHLDIPSLRLLGMDTPLLVPRRAGPFLMRRGFTHANELVPWEAVDVPSRDGVGAVRVIATPARHTGFRPPFGPFGGCLGFIIEGSLRVYFAGDTDIFPEMASLGPIDIAVLPVAGWGPTLGPGHMNARIAAMALQLIRPKIAIPMHWGTFAPMGMHLRTWQYLVRPPLEFLEHSNKLAPDVDVRILEPGESLFLDPLPGIQVSPPALTTDGGIL
jgi:L-ascorbate metabolism protein UlaG (beta-lactamase superfamily)